MQDFVHQQYLGVSRLLVISNEPLGIRSTVATCRTTSAHHPRTCATAGAFGILHLLSRVSSKGAEQVSVMPVIPEPQHMPETILSLTPPKALKDVQADKGCCVLGLYRVYSSVAV